MNAEDPRAAVADVLQVAGLTWVLEEIVRQSGLSKILDALAYITAEDSARNAEKT